MDVKKFVERDNSWLSFNARVLQEANDETVPLYERLKFLAIYSSNLDEFFRVRVSAMRGFKDLKKKTRKKYGLKPKKILKHILNTVQIQQQKFGQIFQKLLDQLIANRIHLIDENQYHEDHKAYVKKLFYMILKMNSLEDKGMINKLYEASQAGVNIQLIVRGICCLIPQVKGLSENIKVRSIIDRFLEHARIYIFGNNGQEKMYLASADWMTRNLDRRIEVVFPIYNAEVYQELRAIVDIQLEDNSKAREINLAQNNAYIHNDKSQIASQNAIYHYLKSGSLC